MTAKIKLNAASGGGSISNQAPSSSSNNRVIALPDIADGTLVTSQSTLDATKLSGALPAISGANLTGISAGITMLDTYYLSSNTGITGGNWNYIKSSFSRLDGTLNSRIRVSGLGTGLTANNAGAATNFSFPSTGFYQIDFTTQISVTSSSSNVYMYTSIWTCIDGSNFDNTVNAISNTFGNSNAVYTTQTASAFIDVTNTTNDKFYLAVLPEVDSNLLGSTSGLYTYLQVKKLADT